MRGPAADGRQTTDRVADGDCEGRIDVVENGQMEARMFLLYNAKLHRVRKLRCIVDSSSSIPAKHHPLNIVPYTGHNTQKPRKPDVANPDKIYS